MTKKIVSIITAMLMVLCFAACGQEEQSDKAYELDGVGVDDILTLEIPEGYEELDVAQNGYGTDAEIISQSWTNEDSTLWISMLSYNGKGVLGKDGSLEDYIEPESIDDIVALNSPQPDAYISYGGGTAEDGTNIENNTIEAVFSYEDYVLSLDMENNNEQSITDEQKETFYSILESIAFKELPQKELDEDTPGSTASLDNLIKFNIPEDFYASATEEAQKDENDNFIERSWYNDTLSLSVCFVEGETDMETFAEGQDLEPQTFGGNTVYMEQFSEETSKHMRSGYIERQGHIIQIDWGKNGEDFTDEDIELFNEILTNMTKISVSESED